MIIRCFVGCLLCSWLMLPLAAQDVLSIPPSLAMTKAVKKVVPELPPAARQLHLKGEQEVALVIGATGDVEEASVLRGNAIFTNATLTAVKQWKFGPHIVDGKPIKVKTTIVFNYN
jgi:TonB family protein